MKPFKLLLVEDDVQDTQVCRSSVETYKLKNKRDIVLVECKSMKEAISKLDNTFDGAIIDLKLDSHGTEGNDVLTYIFETGLRIPATMLTGTPGAVDLRLPNIGIFKKGEVTYAQIIDDLWEIYETGLTRIMGGRGVIEESLRMIFFFNILPQRKPWVEYAKQDPQRTEKALLRHTLNHLLQLMDEETDLSYPEEVYIHPPIATPPKTGSVVAQKDNHKLFVVLSPPCDLAVHEKGEFKTDRILLVEVDDESVVSEALKMPGYKSESELKKVGKCKHHNADAVSYKLLLKNHYEARSRAVKSMLLNSHSHFYHWLPNTSFFPGGFLNFRKLSTTTKTEFAEKFHPSQVQIAPSFTKDILARFASYYARQGQPDIDATAMIMRYLTVSPPVQSC